MGRNQKRGNPKNAGQFAPDTRGKDDIPTPAPVSSLGSPESPRRSNNFDEQHASMLGALYADRAVPADYSGMSGWNDPPLRPATDTADSGTPPAPSTPATKQEIQAVVAPIAGGKFKVAPEGAVNRRPTTARLRMGKGTRSTYTTKLERNGRIMATIWGRNAETKTEQAAAAFTEAGYTIDDQGGDWLIVHNGTVLNLDGAIRFEGQY